MLLSMIVFYYGEKNYLYLTSLSVIKIWGRGSNLLSKAEGLDLGHCVPPACLGNSLVPTELTGLYRKASNKVCSHHQTCCEDSPGKWL